MTDNIISERGYVIIAVNPIEYRQAQCCAYSIKSKMPEASVTLVVGDEQKVQKKFLDGFDAITELPFVSATTRRQNDWQLYWASPYEYTIAIDCSTLVKTDQSSIWDYLIDHHDIVFPNSITNIRKAEIYPTYKKYFKTEYNLDIIYNSVFFFKKNETTLKHFKMADVYFQYWKDVCGKYLRPEHMPDYFDPDIMHTLVAEHTYGEVLTIHNILSYIDMQNSVNTRLNKTSKWTDKFTVWPSNAGKIKIQNYAINDILYYHNDEFLTQEIFNEQRKHYDTITK